jgi:UDP-N-acetylglucosamine 4-epimerase
MKSVLSNTAPYINGDGEQTRDFTFVQNAVHANIQALMSETKGHEVINIAFGERTSLNQLWKYISEIGNSKLFPLYRSSRLGDVRDSLADISKARKLINYNPTFSIQQGLKTTFDWYLEHGK